MALKMYSDAGCTTEIQLAQSFPGNGATTGFTLTSFPGASLNAAYLETQTSQAGVTFGAGVGSGFSGLVTNALVGYRVIHNGTFRGTVTSNTTTTVTISDLTYTQASTFTAILSVYAKLANPTDYSVSSNTVNLVVAPTASQILHLIPNSTLGANFGGVAGTVKTTAVSFWLRRSPITGGGTLNTYDTLQVQSLDHSQTQASLTQTGTTYSLGVGSGFSGLVAGSLIGRAVNHGGTYRGTVTANTTTTVTISDLTYTNAVAADSVVYTIGSCLFAPDVAGAPGVYSHVIQPSAITDDTAVRVWMKDTVTVPNAAMNYPNQIPYVTGIEYLA